MAHSYSAFDESGSAARPRMTAAMLPAAALVALLAVGAAIVIAAPGRGDDATQAAAPVVVPEWAVDGVIEFDGEPAAVTPIVPRSTLAPDEPGPNYSF